MTFTIGEPTWTAGHFKRAAAIDDLGLESVGAGLLRRLIPGVVETSISSAYFAYYPFLLQEFARRSPDATALADFKQFYRRQEAAFAPAKSQPHRRVGTRCDDSRDDGKPARWLGRGRCFERAYESHSTPP
jgi:hypothetical protein